jgi:phage repressor protein C with HTH and peptisase S24 domain
MARRRNPPELVRAKWQLADRIRSIRTELYGERGLADLAKQIGVPVRTWYSYETGVTVPAEVLLRFIELTHVEPLWLLHGQGNKLQSAAACLPAGSEADGFAHSGRSEAAEQRFWGARFEVELPAEDDETEGESAVAVAVLEAPARSIGGPIGSRVGAEVPARTATRRTLRCVRMEGDAMLPIIAAGAFVAFADAPEEPAALEGKMVVARIGGRTLVRWFHRYGQYALLRAENSTFEPKTELIDLAGQNADQVIRRVLWIGTSH